MHVVLVNVFYYHRHHSHYHHYYYHHQHHYEKENKFISSHDGQNPYLYTINFIKYLRRHVYSAQRRDLVKIINVCSNFFLYQDSRLLNT